MVEIPVYIHVIQGERGRRRRLAADRPDEGLNDSYDGTTGGDATGFSFALIDADVTIRRDWYPLEYESAESDAMKNALHEGGARALNLYLVDISDGILGWATFPDEYAGAPAMDGVVVDSGTVPGGTEAPV